MTVLTPDEVNREMLYFLESMAGQLKPQPPAGKPIVLRMGEGKTVSLTPSEIVERRQEISELLKAVYQRITASIQADEEKEPVLSEAPQGRKKKGPK